MNKFHLTVKTAISTNVLAAKAGNCRGWNNISWQRILQRPEYDVLLEKQMSEAVTLGMFSQSDEAMADIKAQLFFKYVVLGILKNHTGRDVALVGHISMRFTAGENKTNFRVKLETAADKTALQQACDQLTKDCDELSSYKLTEAA